ncbi:putative oxidoreductase YoxD [Psilocybe cubensis]|uniref:Oxidoreductase YoxD n=2 Tax=Psilocybe cubensis TaxID=181762 RepID=A0ACB8GN56_PSICU|nr:putative oxidoreductase YoxD [Psilocybe cubensis]KAH9477083.1 putative oxidoreductase YoxD [Psilocybe cubensis]
MASHAAKRVLVIAGAGNPVGTGAATARMFAKNGYTVALIGREGSDGASALVEEINQGGGQAKSFGISSYSHDEMASVWSSIHAHFPKSRYAVRAAVYNVGSGVFKPFLDVSPQDLHSCMQSNVFGAFAFSRNAILTFKGNDIDEPSGKRGALIFTGATASMRGNVMTSAFAAGKWGTRALSQSLAKEFGKENIHVAHVIIDGVIALDPKADPEAVKDTKIKPDSIASSYLYLANQDRSAWTWELDLRSAHEKW